MIKKISIILFLAFSLYGLVGSLYSLVKVHPAGIKSLRGDRDLSYLIAQKKQIQYDDKFERWINSLIDLNFSSLRVIKSLSAVLFVLSLINIIYFGFKIISNFREKKSI